MEAPRSNNNQPPPPPNDDGGAIAATTTGGGRLWKLLVSIADSLFVPCTPPNVFLPSLPWANIFSITSTSPVSSSGTVVIGTILSDQETTKNKVKLCFQLPQDPNPFLFLDLPISHLDSDDACRVVLECDRVKSGGRPLMSVVTWAVYFNGKRVGFGSRREVDAGAGWALDSLRGVSTGVGVLPPPPTADDGPRLGYMRGKFERVVGSADSESYHFVDPAGCLGGNELSFFFVRL
ncbi:uncharacterized protein A4U43_C03F22560 [Asparagus officinalis]|uniref:Protein MIZU-KUSSEI 1 n=1 Tax=Asparagus officinalis TaxID=4686 RepID=A0A5P1FGH5_ASPOF|nr:protein MIZU-KUSSEI 1-like [Asparagus officinalis]ONK75979.1 uncharacterized protein A4U43_C03F22560 [Asparagus officinalis]